PGNNYNLHAVATLAEKISTGERANGLVTALGWFMHKHAAGIYGATPSSGDLTPHDIIDQKENLIGNAPVNIKEQVTGTGTIETYTVIYATDQTPSYAVVYGKTQDNFRFIAGTHTHPDIFKQLTTENWVGRNVRLHFDPSRNMNMADLI
ncbi:MAG: hypothetical protein KAH09_06195, partial [Desulfobacula sp.]|nr:hypothetical protein [Desulfobacula sp.]